MTIPITVRQSAAEHVVILTGGGVPGEEDNPPEPHENDLALALDRAAAAAGVDEVGGYRNDWVARTVAAEAFKVGYHQAAMLHRVVAVYVVDGEEAAARFAAVMTAEVDPVYPRKAADPMLELLKCAEQAGLEDSAT